MNPQVDSKLYEIKVMLRVAVAVDKFPNPTAKANESMTDLGRFK